MFAPSEHEIDQNVTYANLVGFNHTSYLLTSNIKVSILLQLDDAYSIRIFSLTFQKIPLQFYASCQHSRTESRHLRNAIYKLLVQPVRTLSAKFLS